MKKSTSKGRKEQPKPQPEEKKRPKLFIGSSSEGLEVAGELQTALEDLNFCEVHIWNQGVFGVGQAILDELVRETKSSQFAVLIFTPDDILSSRDTVYPAVRDNVLFELGLFIGGLGQDKTFIVHRRHNPPKIPSDFDGIVKATYDANHSNLRAALNPAAIRIQKAVERTLTEKTPQEVCHDILSRMIDRYPLPIQENDLALFTGNNFIDDTQYIKLRDKLQKKMAGI